MKIALTQNTATVSGVPNYILQLALGLRDRGHEVWIIMPEGEMTKIYRQHGLVVVVMAPQSNIDWRYITSLQQWLMQHEIDVLHTNMLKTTVNGLIAGYLAKVPVRVAHIHGTLIDWEVPWYKKLPNVVVNTLISNWLATDVVALTVSIKEQLVHQEHIARSKITVIPNGIDPSELVGLKKDFIRHKFNLESGIPVIGTFSRLTIEKGLMTLIDALPLVLCDIPNLRLFIGGDGDQRQALEKRVAELGLERTVTFIGFLPEADKFLFIAGLDAYVFPSIREGFGLTLIEAMAVGTLVACSDLPVLKDIVNKNQTGLLWSTGNIHDLAQCITGALRLTPNNRHTIIKNAQHEVATNYTIAQFIDRYIALYQHRNLHEA